MIKKTLTHSVAALSLLALSSTAFAVHENFCGFYGNLSGGFLQTLAKINLSSSADVFIAVPPERHILSVAQQERTWENAFMGSFSLGYAKFFDERWRLAGEIYVSVSNSRATLDHHASTFNPTQVITDTNLLSSATADIHNWDFGIDLLPGVLIDKCNLVYGRIGVSFNKHSVESRTIYEGRFPPGGPLFNVDLPVYVSSDDSNVGLRLGLGWEHNICPNLAVTTDYIFTYYGTTDGSGTAEQASAVVPIEINYVSASVSSQYRTQALMVGVKYYFM